MAKLRMKNGKKVRKAMLNIGPIFLLLAAAVAIFMIGRAIGKKERYYPIVINKYTRTLDTNNNSYEAIRQRLQNLSQI